MLYYVNLISSIPNSVAQVHLVQPTRDGKAETHSNVCGYVGHFNSQEERISTR